MGRIFISGDDGRKEAHRQKHDPNIKRLESAWIMDANVPPELITKNVRVEKTARWSPPNRVHGKPRMCVLIESLFCAFVGDCGFGHKLTINLTFSILFIHLSDRPAKPQLSPSVLMCLHCARFHFNLAFASKMTGIQRHRRSRNTSSIKATRVAFNRRRFGTMRTSIKCIFAYLYRFMSFYRPSSADRGNFNLIMQMRCREFGKKRGQN